jgi:hypothetical protein
VLVSDGRHDGMVGDRRYFRASARHGLFVPPHRVKLFDGTVHTSFTLSPLLSIYLHISTYISQQLHKTHVPVLTTYRY